ncbi:hypothetical protein Ancab_014627 [Ancistrocladus abbreviatus]
MLEGFDVAGCGFERGKGGGEGVWWLRWWEVEEAGEVWGNRWRKAARLGLVWGRFLVGGQWGGGAAVERGDGGGWGHNRGRSNLLFGGLHLKNNDAAVSVHHRSSHSGHLNSFNLSADGDCEVSKSGVFSLDSLLLSLLYLVLMMKAEEKPSTSPQSFIDQLVDCDAISVMKAGKLRFSKPNKYWVECSQKRYVPCVEDHVLGIVVDCKADNFLVDIKGPTLAFLPVLAFEGVIRRNIPRFETGTLLYARVVKTNAGMNPELSCMDASGKAAEFGPLKDGYMFESSTGLSRMLLSSPTCPVLDDLGKKLSFEIAAGLNGRVWVNAASPSTVILVANAIMNSESLSGVQQKIMVEKLLQRVQ